MAQKWFFQTKLKILQMGVFDFLGVPRNIPIYSKFFEKTIVYKIRGRALDEHLSDLCLHGLASAESSFFFPLPPSVLSIFSANFQRLGCVCLCV